MSIKIAAMSDLHGDLPEMVEPCELVLICGDISPLKIQSGKTKMRRWLFNKFLPWASQLPCDKVLFIAGNHDMTFDNLDFIYSIFSKDKKVTYLFHENYIYTGRDGKEYSIFGTPYCKLFGNWAFMTFNDHLRELYSDIPENLDILMTHDCPYGYNDIIIEEIPWNTYEHIGNIPLAEEVLKKGPKVLVRGHLHATDRFCMINNTRHYNVSIKNEKYETVFPITYLEI